MYRAQSFFNNKICSTTWTLVRVKSRFYSSTNPPPWEEEDDEFWSYRESTKVTPQLERIITMNEVSPEQASQIGTTILEYKKNL